MNNNNVELLRELMKKLINTLPQNEPEVMLLKKYRATVNNINTIFEKATNCMGDKQITKDILGFFMQTEALTDQFIKNSEEK